MKLGVVILAAGSGERFGADVPKQFVPLNGKEIWRYSYEVFTEHMDVDGMVVVFPPDDPLVSSESNNFINGGATRRESSLLGIKHLINVDPEITHVLIHDGVRPFITKKIIDDCVDGLESGYNAVDVTIPSADSVARVTKDGAFIEKIPDRSRMRLGQTPQGFRIDEIVAALEHVPEGAYTDDIGILLAHIPDAKIKNVDGSEDNMKITTQSDLIKAERMANKYMESRCFDIAGKKAVVLGASGGIGQAVCTELQKRGISKIYTPSARDRIVEDIVGEIEEPVDIAITCIGQLTKENFFEMAKHSPSSVGGSKWYDEFRVNFLMQLQFLYDVVRFNRLKNDGAFVFVGSSSAYHGRPGYSAYCSAKAALMNFVQSVGAEDISVRVNLVNPGRCDTNMRRKMFGKEDKNLLATPERVAEKIVDVCAMPCSGSIFDIRANEIDT